jgi:hypothetical protein
VRDRLADLGDAAVAAITFAEPVDLPAHRAYLDLPFPLLADPDRGLYRRFGLGRGSIHRIWGTGTLKMYARLLRRGRRLRRPTQDTRQLGGDFVIDADGRMSAEFRPTSPDGRPPIDDLITAVQATR